MTQSRDLSRPRNIWLLPLLLVGALFLIGCGDGGSTTPSSIGGGGGIADGISGKVTDYTGAPVVGALVKLLLVPVPGPAKAMAQEGQVYQDTTDQNGDYEFTELPAGLYRMEVDAPGQLPWGKDLDLREKGAVVQDAQLWPPTGQMAVFLSKATDLVAGDTDDGYWDIYLAHTGGGIEKLSNTPAGQNAGDSLSPVLSDSNRVIVFASLGQLVPEDQNDAVDVYRLDREMGTLTCLTADPDFHKGSYSIYDTRPFTSGSGQFTVFEWGETGNRRIFLHDAQTGEFTQVSVGLNEDGAPNGDCERPTISAFGRYIAFESKATNLVPDQDPDDNHRNIFVHDRLTGTTVRASLGVDSENPDNDSDFPSISADGNLVAFRSKATNLLADPSPSGMIYVRDMATKTTTMVSVDNDGNPAAETYYTPTISGNGRYVAFSTDAALVPEDTNGKWDVYLRDLREGTTILVSQNATAINGGNYDSSFPMLSFDGAFALFTTWATDLIPGGAPSIYAQVYVRDLLNGLNDLVSSTPAKVPGNQHSCTR
ncbi:MAG: carboxypeptidase regulatory-like domain-containing protein [Candidatus Xenobium sp.]|jgi:Tol biopolymer transport system component